jgi:hypothetical protein
LPFVILSLRFFAFLSSVTDFMATFAKAVSLIVTDFFFLMDFLDGAVYFTCFLKSL